MDETGSTTFVLFDRIVTQFIGRNVQDLIAEMKEPNNKDEYPAEFNFFLDKQMLFKVEVSDVNVNKNWRNYGVKKATDDVAVITEFISKYNIKVSNPETEVDNALDIATLGSDANDLDVVEHGDSCSNNKAKTPITKSGTKRSSDGADSAGLSGIELGERSINKPTKMVRVKIEPPEKKLKWQSMEFSKVQSGPVGVYDADFESSCGVLAL